MGSSGGKGGASAAAGTQADIARQLFAQSGPLRDLLLGSPGTPATAGQPGRLLGGTFKEEDTLRFGPPIPGQAAVPGTPGLLQNLLTQPAGVFPAERETLESQFGRARENILAATPARGGALQSTLAQLELQRALGVSGLESMAQQRQTENLFRTLGGVTGQTQLSLGGLGSAGNIFAQQQAAELGLAGQLGLGAGLTAGAAKGASRGLPKIAGVPVAAVAA